MAGPVGRTDLLSDQAVAGVGVGRAQQGLGQAHQGQTFAGAQAEFLQEALDHALALLTLAGAFDQADGVVQDRRATVRRQGFSGQQFGHHLTFVPVLVPVQLIPMAKIGRRHEIHPVNFRIYGDYARMCIASSRPQPHRIRESAKSSGESLIRR
ncbi:hypothetical protein D3C73_1013110 [compost metagenome]